MSKRGMIQGMAVAMLASTLLTGGCTKLVYADCLVANEDAAVLAVSETNSQDNSRSAQLVWVVKEENGKKYRRLYDATNEVWLTDWILCE